MYELDFLQVGTEQKSDAIALRFAYEGRWVVVIIDGVGRAPMR